jgi:hypothetical protein
MESFVAWLGQTPLSAAVNAQGWIVPFAQAMHIGVLAICAFCGVLWVLSCANMLGPALSPPLQRLLPRFVWTALLLLLVTGATLILSEPGRELLAISFWLKMGLVAGLAATFWYWQNRKATLRRRHVIAIAATFLAIIFFGRMIAIDSTLWTLNG